MRFHKILPWVLFAGCVCFVGCSKQPKTLRVWQTETDKNAVEELNRVKTDFEASHPGVKVELESVAWSSLGNKLSVAIQTRNEPDVAHLEPFMTASVLHRGLLLPIDDVINDIEKENNDTIYEGVRDLQLFDGKRYGIAYAVGTTGWAYRKDIADKLHLTVPTKWNDYIRFVDAMRRSDPNANVLLPGGDPFFVDQLFAELLANNGGKLFDPVTRRPLLTSQEAVQTLQFFQSLSPSVDPGWIGQAYLDQFNRMGRGEAGNVPVTYARAGKAIQNVIKERQTKDLQATPAFFALMPQPTGPSYNGASIATIDCEPYVIFRSTEQRGTTSLAKEFLKLFYKREHYVTFTRAVPIHLTPIFKKMSADSAYLSDPYIQNWKQWADQTSVFLADQRRLRPILMPDVSEAGRQLPFLLEFQANKILTQAVVDVVHNHVDPTAAARSAQEQAERLVESLGERRW
jgi:multiple sugar transport system substrate-binding protein